MTQAACFCPDEFDSGLWVNHWGGPRITPYAQAIADCYDVVIPFFMTVPLRLQGSTSERRIITTSPYQYDTLLMGAHINGFDAENGDSGQQVYLNVSDDRTRLPWVTPSPIGWAPLTAFAGLNLNVMPILKLPEAYFLPRHVSLEHSIFNLTNSQAVGGSITWVGLQLINTNKNCPAPEKVTLANGNVFRVGQRQPLFMPLPMGRESYVAGVFSYQVVAGGNYIQYTAPLDCDAEIHGIASADLFTAEGVTLDPDNLLIKVSDMGDREMWRPDRAASTSVVGDFTQVYPSLPFTKPYTLKKGHRLQVSIQNNTDEAFNNMFLTVRGVRLCEY